MDRTMTTRLDRLEWVPLRRIGLGDQA